MNLYYARSKKGSGQFSVKGKVLLCNEPSVIKQIIISYSTFDVEEFEIVKVDPYQRICNIIDNQAEVSEASKERECENNPKERTWFGNDVAYDFPNCENYKDGRCEVINCACKDEIACNTKFKKRWERE